MFKRQKKHYLELTSEEYRLLVRSAIWWRNKLIEQGYYADTVSDLLIKLVKSESCL